MAATASACGSARPSARCRPTWRPACTSAVDAFHAAALSSGGTDNGPPGLRDDYGPDYYAAFVIDPDGYRLEAYCGRHA
jgi:hypothetical protein